MPIQHTARSGKTFYLHQGVTKTGKPKYFFSSKSEGIIVDSIPEGFEVYESPNAQVLLRRIRPKNITDKELQIVEQKIRQSFPLKYQIDVKKDAIIIYVADQNIVSFARLLNESPRVCAKEIDGESLLRQTLTYSPMLQFVLVDAEKREFITQRYCFLGSVNDWITIGTPSNLSSLIKKHARHLRDDSSFALF